MRLVSTIILFFFSIPIWSQIKTDTLCIDFQGKMLPSDKLNCWLHYCELNHFSQPTIVFQLLQTADSFAQINQLYTLQNERYYQWGNYYKTIHQFDSAEYYYLKALTPNKQVTDDFIGKVTLKLASVYIETDNYRKYSEASEKLIELTKIPLNNLQKGQLFIIGGDFKNHLGMYPESIDSYHQAFDIFKELKDTFLMVDVFLKLGLVHEKSGNYPVSSDFFEKAIRAYQKLSNPFGIAIAELHKGYVFFKKGDYESALKLSLSSHDYFYKNGFPLLLIHSQKQLGQIYLHQKNFMDSRNSLQEALLLSLKLPDNKLRAEVMMLLGELSNEMHKPSEAEVHFKNALSLSESIKHDELRVSILNELTTHFVGLGNYKSAMNYQTQLFLLEKQMDDKIRIIKQTLNDDKWAEILKENENRQMELLTSALRERHMKKIWFWLFLGLSFVFIIGTTTYIFITLNQIKKGKKIISNKQHKINRQHQYILQLKKQLELTEQSSNRFFTITTQNIFEPVRALENVLNEIGQHQSYLKDLNSEPLVLSYNLLENLLYWSRNQLEKIALEPQEVNLNELIENLIQFQKPRTLSKKTIIRFYPEQPIVGYFDKKLLEIAIRNIIDNAIKFSTNDSDIIIRSKQDLQNIILSITDEGIGMTREQLSRLFLTSKNYESAGTHGEKGGGIGLTLAKTFIERNFGHLSIESSIAFGTKVTILLPLSKISDSKA